MPTENEEHLWGRYNDQYVISLLKVWVIYTYWKVSDLQIRMLPVGLS